MFVKEFTLKVICISFPPDRVMKINSLTLATYTSITDKLHGSYITFTIKTLKDELILKKP